MTGIVKEWVVAFARQADADFKAWQGYQQYPEVVECHKLLFLQMACEKLCKGYLVKNGAHVAAIEKSHAYIAKPLPVVIAAEIVFRKKNLAAMNWVMQHVRHLAREIELVNPALDANGKRPANCEYPWEVSGQVFSPLDHSFGASRLIVAPAGREFLKLVRLAIDRLLA
jgi:hypothetical protein